MEGLLDTGRGNHVCNSVQDMQTRLQNLLASKSSDTRAEHASFTFELRNNTVFHLGADAENGSPEGDPTQTIARSVNASETIHNQPSDDPVLQRAVAKHIVNAMGIIDSSSWVVRQVSRDARGWTFTYNCKDSLQAWMRTSAKGPEKPVIASYSGPGGLDPVNLSRPAFDCRGTFSVAFSTSARAIVVKYNHTPIHKTVAQLVQLLAPALPPSAQNTNASNRRAARAKRPPPPEGEEGSRRKRQKKKGKAPEAPMGETPAAESSSTAAQNGQENNAPQPAVSDGLHLTSILNVPPVEAERRRQTAIDLLNGKGINPATLTAEQFNIFANQAPELQTASLDMLARYGAERLRIVHPDEKGQASSASSTPAEKQPVSATPTAVPATTSTPGTTETPTKKRRSRKKKSDGPVAAEVSIGDGAVVSVEQSGEVGTTASALQPKGTRTRGSCQVCKERKIKCTKQHPSCSNCVNDGIGCVYSAPRPRRKRSGVNGKIEEQEDSDLPGETQEYQAEEVQTQAPAQISTSQAPVQHSVSTAFPPRPDPDNEEFIPDPNILSGPIEHQNAITLGQPPTRHSTESPGYFHRIKFPSSSRGSGKHHMEMPELTYPESHTQATHSESTPNLALSSVSHQSNFPAEVAYPQATPAASGKKRNTSASTRRSLPSGHTKQTPVPAPSIPQNTPNWNTSPAPVHATTASPTLTKKQTPKRSRARKSAVTENNQQEHEQGQEQDGMKQAAALSQAAIQTQSRPSPAVESPYLTATRASSRQANRSQTSTPVASTSRPEPQAPPVVTNASYNTTSTTSISNYDPYARYDNSTSSQYANIANDQGSSRIAYEPGSYQPTTGVTTTSMSYSTAPAYNYSQGNRSSNPLSQALNTSTGYTTNSSTTAQWAPPRPSSTQPHTQSQTTNSYSMSSAATAASHGYGAVSSGIRAQHRNAPYNQPQSQPSYGSYTAQQPSTSQQPQADWYRFASTNNSSNANQSSYTRNQTSGYSNTTNSARATSYSTQRYENQDFGARSDDQSLYDLLRASGSTH